MRRVLLIEDSPSQAAELTGILRQAGFEVDTAPDAEQGFEQVARHPFDLVLCDILLPGASGLQFCRRVKEDAQRRYLPVVLITASPDPANVLRGLEVGADGFIGKGREPEEIVRRLGRALALGPPSTAAEIPVTFLDQHFGISAERERLLEILLSAFEDVIQLDECRKEESARRTQAEGEIRRLSRGFEQEVIKRTAELAETNRQLRHRNEENELFVYTVSHDLRSPLVNLEGFSKQLELSCQDLRALLSQTDVPPGVGRGGLALLDQGMAESIRFIRTAVRRLSTIIDALLRLSRAGRVELRCQQVDVHDVVTRIVQSLGSTIAERHATVTVKELPPAWGDPTAVERIFANLLGNALAYLDPRRPGVIEVGVEVSPESPAAGTPGALWTYSVRDNGLGIPKSYQAKLFQGLQHLHPDAATGEGMGLAIVRRLVERHGGSTWVDSTAGVGSTFFVTLPALPGNGTSQPRGQGEQALPTTNRESLT